MQRLLLFITLTTLIYQTARGACALKTEFEQKGLAATVATLQKAKEQRSSQEKKAGYIVLDPLLPQDLPGEIHELIRAYCREYIDYLQIAYQPIDQGILKLSAEELTSRLEKSHLISHHSESSTDFFARKRTTQCIRKYANDIILKENDGKFTLENPAPKQTIELSETFFPTCPTAITNGPCDTVIFCSCDIIQIRNNKGLVLAELRIRAPSGNVTSVFTLDDGSFVIEVVDVKDIMKRIVYVWQPNISCLHNMSLQQLYDLKLLLNYIQKCHSTSYIYNNEERNLRKVVTLNPMYFKIYFELSEELQDKISNWFNIVVEREETLATQETALPRKPSICDSCCIQ